MKNNTLNNEELKWVIARNYKKYKAWVTVGYIISAIFLIPMSILAILGFAYFIMDIDNKLNAVAFLISFVICIFLIIAIRKMRNTVYKRIYGNSMEYEEFYKLDKSGELTHLHNEYKKLLKEDTSFDKNNIKALSKSYKNGIITENLKIEIARNYINYNFNQVYKKTITLDIIKKSILATLTIIAGYFYYNPYYEPLQIIIEPIFTTVAAYTSFALIRFPTKQKFKELITDKIKYSDFKKAVKSGEVEKWCNEYKSSIHSEYDIDEIAEDTANLCAVETAPSDIEDTADTDGGEDNQ